MLYKITLCKEVEFRLTIQPVQAQKREGWNDDGDARKENSVFRKSKCVKNEKFIAAPYVKNTWNL